MGKKSDTKLNTTTGTLRLLCKKSRMWGIYFKNNTSGAEDDLLRWYKDSYKANKLLKKGTQEAEYVLTTGWGIKLFKTRRAMETGYKHIVGDDGPTKLNRHRGRGNWYAVTCSPDGLLLNENT